MFGSLPMSETSINVIKFVGLGYALIYNKITPANLMFYISPGGKFSENSEKYPFLGIC